MVSIHFSGVLGLCQATRLKNTGQGRLHRWEPSSPRFGKKIQDLRDIQPIVKKLCAKHGIPYHHTSGYKEAIMGVYEHIREMGCEPTPETSYDKLD